MTTTVHGVVAPGFERVREVVEATKAPWGRGGGGLSAYVDGELVVDLWGGVRRPGQEWEADTLAPVASISKSWAACVVHRLVEQGTLDFTTPLCTWWPEFAAHGKQDITLREVFLHSSGVLGFDDQLAVLDGKGKGEGWGDYDAIAAGLAAAKPVWTPGTQHGYHAVSFGWLVQEVVRRTTGRTVGDIFRTDFAEPLGLDTFLGGVGPDFGRVALTWGAELSTLPWLQRRLMNRIAKHTADPTTLAGIALLGDGRTSVLERAPEYLAIPAWVEAEVPASNGVTTVRSLAKLFAALAAGGTLDGVTVLQPESVELMRMVQLRVTDSVLGGAVPALVRRLAAPSGAVTYGLMANLEKKGELPLGPNPEAFASGGFGGQLVMGDPVARISLASTCSDFTPGLDAIVAKVRKAVYESCSR